MLHSAGRRFLAEALSEATAPARGLMRMALVTNSADDLLLPVMHPLVGGERVPDDMFEQRTIDVSAISSPLWYVRVTWEVRHTGGESSLVVDGVCVHLDGEPRRAEVQPCTVQRGDSLTITVPVLVRSP
jgi:hypothetical protein